jgi:L,D-peptidoglycan transpeptidase YkuD (ErfK/YbiS/YcfS/YnhG family)
VLLIALRLRWTRPAAPVRRRSFLFVALIGVLAGSLAAGHGPGVGGPVPAGAELARLRASARDAVAALRQPSPAAARRLDGLIADAEAITAQESTAPAWRRSPGRIEAAWNRILVTARASLVDLRRRERTFSERWESLAFHARKDVERALEESQEAGVGRREIAAARQAEQKWTLAQKYAATGAHERAIAEAEQARHFAEVVHASFADLHARFRDPKNLAKWRRMVEETVARSKREGTTVFVVDKLRRRLHVYAAGKRVATYEAELGAKGLRQKYYSGDQATPEGTYRVTEVRGPGRTKYYKALMLDYPNSEDRARHAWGRRTGQVPLRAGVGSLIEIHGDGGQGRDWTDGCVALSNSDMDRVFARAQVGTAVTIVGTF